MSVSFSAKAKNTMANSLADIKNYCDALSENHLWKGENMVFFLSGEALLGSFKCDWKSVFSVYEDIDFAVTILSRSSGEFKCDWEVSFPEWIGEIRQGTPDLAILEMLATFRKMAENQRKKAERPQWNPAEKDKKPRATNKKKFQGNWNTETIRKALKDSNFTHSLTDKNRNDLRGIEVNIPSQLLQFTNTDFSYAKLRCKLAVENSVLDFIEAEDLVIQRLKNCSVVASNIGGLRQSAVSLSDFSMAENDFSYSKIGEISGNIRLTEIPSVENSIFDFGQIKGVKSAYLKDCSFKNTNFNQSEIHNSVFENCDFTGASFDNVHYVKSRFINCKGLDKSKMVDYFLIFYGETLSDPTDISVE